MEFERLVVKEGEGVENNRIVSVAFTFPSIAFSHYLEECIFSVNYNTHFLSMLFGCQIIFP